jgi:hypothetical protein
MYTEIVIRPSKNRVKIDGTTSVLIRYSHDGTIYIKTGIYVIPDHFDNSTHNLKKEYGRSYNLLNNKLYDKRDEVELYVERYRQFNGFLPSSKTVMRHIIRTGDARQFDVLKSYEDYIEFCTPTKAEATIGTYKITFRYLKDFMSNSSIHIKSFRDINEMFYSEFKKYLSSLENGRFHKKLSEVTVINQLKNIKVFSNSYSNDDIKINKNIKVKKAT